MSNLALASIRTLVPALNSRDVAVRQICEQADHPAAIYNRSMNVTFCHCGAHHYTGNVIQCEVGCSAFDHSVDTYCTRCWTAIDGNVHTPHQTTCRLAFSGYCCGTAPTCQSCCQECAE